MAKTNSNLWLHARIVSTPFYGFDHAKVAQKFGGELTFVNEFCIKGNYFPYAVYYAAKPNRKKGHKDYMLLRTTNDGEGIVAGMDAAEMEKEAMQEGILCTICDEVLYSVYRHDAHDCRGGHVGIDGGKDYVKVTITSGAHYESVTINLLNNTYKKVPTRKPKRNISRK